MNLHWALARHAEAPTVSLAGDVSVPAPARVAIFGAGPETPSLLQALRPLGWHVSVVERMASDDIVIFCDIDAFPLKRSAYDLAVAHAEQGAIFGLSQFSNHKTTTETYAGPMFMAFRKSVWEQLGRPDMKSSSAWDAAEGMSVLAREKGVPFEVVGVLDVKGKAFGGNDQDDLVLVPLTYWGLVNLISGWTNWRQQSVRYADKVLKTRGGSV